jgi:hypothetical protein
MERRMLDPTRSTFSLVFCRSGSSSCLSVRFSPAVC